MVFSTLGQMHVAATRAALIYGNLKEKYIFFYMLIYNTLIVNNLSLFQDSKELQQPS